MKRSSIHDLIVNSDTSLWSGCTTRKKSFRYHKDDVNLFILSRAGSGSCRLAEVPWATSSSERESYSYELWYANTCLRRVGLVAYQGIEIPVPGYDLDRESVAIAKVVNMDRSDRFDFVKNELFTKYGIAY